MMPVAILDFGTNTFNLLIAEQKGSGFTVLYNGKQPVKLGKGGINNRFITPDAMKRGFTAISNHMKTVREFGAAEIHAYATSAIRNAGNGKEFVAMIQQKFGFKTQIIDGEEEASLIYKGIRESVDFGKETAMILDIGGGSNEFIICNAEGILWKRSFELGMARIIERFNISDPITQNEIQTLEAYYLQELGLLLEHAEKYNPSLLVGASGTFDTLAAMAENRYGIRSSDHSSVKIKLEHFLEMHQSLLESTTEERLAMAGMEPVRVEMIVPASIFIKFVYDNCKLTSITQSRNALKEGVMATLVSKR